MIRREKIEDEDGEEGKGPPFIAATKQWLTKTEKISYGLIF
jgi:hypothetical protein